MRKLCISVYLRALHGRGWGYTKMFSQFFVLSGRGDTLVFRDCMFSSLFMYSLFTTKRTVFTRDICFFFSDRGDVARGSPEIFFKSVKKWKDEKGAFPPPAIVSHLVQYQFWMPDTLALKVLLLYHSLWLFCPTFRIETRHTSCTYDEMVSTL